MSCGPARLCPTPICGNGSAHLVLLAISSKQLSGSAHLRLLNFARGGPLRADAVKRLRRSSADGVDGPACGIECARAMVVAIAHKGAVR